MNLGKLIGIPLGTAFVFFGTVALVFSATVYQPNQQLESEEGHILNFSHMSSSSQQLNRHRFSDVSTDGWGNQRGFFWPDSIMLLLFPKEIDAKNEIFANMSLLSYSGFRSLFVGRYISGNYTLLENYYGDLAVQQTPQNTPYLFSIMNRLRNVFNDSSFENYNLYILRLNSMTSLFPMNFREIGAEFFMSNISNIASPNQFLIPSLETAHPPLHELPEELRPYEPAPEEPGDNDIQYEERITLDFNLRFNFITTENEFYRFENISVEEIITMIVNGSEYTFTLDMIVNKDSLLHSLSSYLTTGDEVIFKIADKVIYGTVEIGSMAQLHFIDVETHIELVEIPGDTDENELPGTDEDQDNDEDYESTPETTHLSWWEQFLDFLMELFFVQNTKKE